MLISSKGISTKKPLISKKSIDGLEVKLKTDKSRYFSREPVTIQLILTNKTDKSFKLTFPSSQMYDFLIKKGNAEIWQWSKGKMFSMVFTEIIIQPNESLIFEEKWNQLNNEDKLIMPGKYIISAILKTYPEIICLTLPIHIVKKSRLPFWRGTLFGQKGFPSKTSLPKNF